ncbi:hypothetical protein GBD64_18095 [Salmonella enterica]|nr:hypothetical protein [Salmonella enterica]ECX7041751.1 hypothetical protein [Salmonella enterica subsp. enterica serovar Poona]EAP9434128.1 hypothetical protein [Salmonella enterica]EAQ4833154.1 hypothetical protein [Salmonella enterica]EAW3425119.1 hypothetical protein [Salmonella enterica]
MTNNNLTDERLSVLIRVARDSLELYEMELPVIDDVMLALAELQQLRAAMLQAGNSPVSPDGLVGRGENCWSCGKYFTYEQHSECDGYCPHCDSPVDLDDEEDEQSKSLPANPTEEMISNAWREALGKCDHETIRRMYVAMLSAAPQQEE